MASYFMYSALVLKLTTSGTWWAPSVNTRGALLLGVNPSFYFGFATSSLEYVEKAQCSIPRILLIQLVKKTYRSEV